MIALERDLRWRTAGLHARAVYALLWSRREEIADVLSIGRRPEQVAAVVWEVPESEAVSELADLRDEGLVGEGLTLLAGVRRARARRATEGGERVRTSATPERVEAARAALSAARDEGVSLRSIARNVGCAESSLRKLLGGGSIGDDLGGQLLNYLSAHSGCALPRALGVRTSDECAVRSAHPSPVFPLSHSPSSSPHPEKSGGVSEGISTSPLVERAERRGIPDSVEGAHQPCAPAVRTDEVRTSETRTESAHSPSVRAADVLAILSETGHVQHLASGATLRELIARLVEIDAQEPMTRPRWVSVARAIRQCPELAWVRESRRDGRVERATRDVRWLLADDRLEQIVSTARSWAKRQAPPPAQPIEVVR